MYKAAPRSIPLLLISLHSFSFHSACKFTNCSIPLHSVPLHSSTHSSAPQVHKLEGQYRAAKEALEQDIAAANAQVGRPRVHAGLGGSWLANAQVWGAPV